MCHSAFVKKRLVENETKKNQILSRSIELEEEDTLPTLINTMKSEENIRPNSEGKDFDRDKFFEEMDIAYKTKAWKKLNQYELELLIIIAESKIKEEMYKKIFQGIAFDSPYSKKIWKVLNHLDLMRLVWIERNEQRAIVKIHIKGELVEELKKEYPDLFMIDRPETIELKNLQFHLLKNPRRKNNDHPEFSGMLTFNKEILLKKGNPYKYGLWKNEDGSLFLRLKPIQISIEEGLDWYQDISEWELLEIENEALLDETPPLSGESNGISATKATYLQNEIYVLKELLKSKNSQLEDKEKLISILEENQK